MGIIKKAFIGAALYFGYKYITKKDPLTGISKMDEIIEEAPKFMDKAKTMVANEKESYKNFI